MRKATNLRWLAFLSVVAILSLVVSSLAQRMPNQRARERFGGNTVLGMVTGGDRTRGVISVQRADGEEVWVALTEETRMTREVEVAPADLQLGQSILITGQPTSIIAQEIRLNPEMGVTSRQEPGAGAGRARGMRAGAGSRGASVVGEITNLEPLTVTTPDATAVTATLAPDVKIVMSASASINDVEVGEQITASGQVGDDGFLYARVVRLGDFGRFMGRGAPPTP